MFKKHFKSIDATYVLLLVICISVIAFYGKYRCDHIQDHIDILEFELLKGSGEYGLDGWSITHILFNMMIGYLYPKTLIPSMVLGVIWELFETYVGVYRPNIIKNYGFCDAIVSLNGQTSSHNWWYGKKSDILANFIGFMLGKTLREKL